VTGDALTRVVYLEHEIVSVVVDVSGGVPTIVHWGAALSSSDAATLTAMITRPTTHGSIDSVPPLQMVPQHSLGSLARPGLLGHRPGGRDWSARFGTCEVDATSRSVVTVSRDEVAKLRLEVRLELDDAGALNAQASVTNEGESRFLLDALTITLPVPSHARDLTTYSGRWSRESSTHRRTVDHGAFSVENRTGRTSHEYPPTLWWSTTDAREWSGEVWGCHLAWSGNHALYAEVMPDGRRYAQLGELLMPGEVCLDPRATYSTPVVVGAYSGAGFTPASWVMHEHVRTAARANAASPRTRKVLINTWEATYFDHDTEKLKALADTAAAVGIERFVLDDGWFGARRDDRAGLGDWVVSKDVWPDGLQPIIKYINDKGIDFGLWFEGEMVNADSDLYRAHPDWILQEPGRIPVEGRWQQVLDLTKEGAYNHVLNQVDAVLSENNISYIKWDHNRHLSDPISDGRPVVRKQTQAIYRLFDELKRRHPGLEIESCALGGGRIDLGMIEHADRFWTSDMNDPLERQLIQRWTGLVIPPEFLGTHIGPTVGHQMHRTHDVSFRALNALFGHAGIEWNITEATDHELEVLKAYSAFYKKNRELLHSGDVVRSDDITGNAQVYGTVSKDQKRAIFTYMQLTSADNFGPLVMTMPGLGDDIRYRVQVNQELSAPEFLQKAAPGWWPVISMTGNQLANIGLQLPVLKPESGLLFEISAE